MFSRSKMEKALLEQSNLDFFEVCRYHVSPLLLKIAYLICIYQISGSKNYIEREDFLAAPHFNYTCTLFYFKSRASI